jgi:AraC-like DNA-binding protein
MAPLPSQGWPLCDLPGLSAQDYQKLYDVEIESTVDLLRRTQTLAKQRHLAEKLQLSDRWVRKWMALAELSHLKSVGCQYCGLLLHAGVTSVAQLSAMSPSTLHRQILRLQVSTLTRRDLCPNAGVVMQWIQEAKLAQRR